MSEADAFIAELCTKAGSCCAALDPSMAELSCKQSLLEGFQLDSACLAAQP